MGAGWRPVLLHSSVSSCGAASSALQPDKHKYVIQLRLLKMFAALYVIFFSLDTISLFSYYTECWLRPPHRVFVDRYGDGYSPVSAPDAASTSALLSPSASPPTSYLFRLPRHPCIHHPRPSVLPRSDCLLPGRPPC